MMLELTYRDGRASFRVNTRALIMVESDGRSGSILTLDRPAPPTVYVAESPERVHELLDRLEGRVMLGELDTFEPGTMSSALETLRLHVDASETQDVQGHALALLAWVQRRFRPIHLEGDDIRNAGIEYAEPLDGVIRETAAALEVDHRVVMGTFGAVLKRLAELPRGAPGGVPGAPGAPA